jgi:anti-anti-sigma regulatory factor
MAPARLSSKKFKAMRVKIDTKEKFHVITVNEPTLTADLAEEIGSRVKEIGQGSVRNVVLNLNGVTQCTPEAAQALTGVQQEAYEDSRSFVLCSLAKELEGVFEELDLLDLLNMTPTESEAWDIVQMEEIEREMLGGE